MSSPNDPSVKVTYGGNKQKKKRAEKSNLSDTEENAPPKKAPSSKVSKKPKSEMKPPDYVPSSSPTSKSKAPKKVEVHLPGPSPQKQRNDDEVSVSSAKAPSKKGHRKSASSMSTTKTGATSSPLPAVKKPISISRLAPVSTKKHEPTPEESDVPDDASVAESTMSVSTVNKIRRTEPERIEYFKNQSECGEFEDHRAFCSRCNKWVNLGKKQTYTVKPWEAHRLKCDQRVFDDAHANDSATTTVGHTEPERRAILETDTRADVVEPNRILCKKCRRWAKSTIKYDLPGWRQHLENCSGPVPSSRVATAERKIQIHNDPVGTPIDPTRVKCNGCDKIVQLDGEGEYNLSKWEEHKGICAKAQALLKLKMSARSKASLRPSPSVASTDATLVAGSSFGTKRRREDDDGAEEGPAAKVARDENYVAPTKEAPGPFGWFMMPVQAFFKGFKESVLSATR